jgi:hypothetical protein
MAAVTGCGNDPDGRRPAPVGGEPGRRSGGCRGRVPGCDSGGGSGSGHGNGGHRGQRPSSRRTDDAHRAIPRRSTGTARLRRGRPGSHVEDSREGVHPMRKNAAALPAATPRGCSGPPQGPDGERVTGEGPADACGRRQFRLRDPYYAVAAPAPETNRTPARLPAPRCAIRVDRCIHRWDTGPRPCHIRTLGQPSGDPRGGPGRDDNGLALRCTPVSTASGAASNPTWRRAWDSRPMAQVGARC